MVAFALICVGAGEVWSSANEGCDTATGFFLLGGCFIRLLLRTLAAWDLVNSLLAARPGEDASSWLIQAHYDDSELPRP